MSPQSQQIWVLLRARLDRDSAALVFHHLTFGRCHGCDIQTVPVVAIGPWIFCSLQCHNFV